jgi:hypothetical protein
MWAPSLASGWVCNLLVHLLVVPVRAVTLGSKSRRTPDHVLLSHMRLPQPGGPGPRIHIPQEQGGPVISPGTGFSFCCLLPPAGISTSTPQYSCIPEDDGRARSGERLPESSTKEDGAGHQRIDIHVVEEYRKI